MKKKNFRSYCLRHLSVTDSYFQNFLVQEPINPNKIRFVAGPFDPKAVALLVRLGIDFFDTSFPVKMTEEVRLYTAELFVLGKSIQG